MDDDRGGTLKTRVVPFMTVFVAVMAALFEMMEFELENCTETAGPTIETIG